MKEELNKKCLEMWFLKKMLLERCFFVDPTGLNLFPLLASAERWPSG
jgi:hypothetical protein